MGSASGALDHNGGATLPVDHRDNTCIAAKAPLTVRPGHADTVSKWS
jgi:hypothetical protein